ncbi:hypothetical protein SAMN04489727_1952 [Amycolatopsis tolypomycina]|uniref:Uncharacterized protein n=1 Tax=Amycolatopsis tolypomycina TaxID=208445 RepID=A0A1H4JJ46_9PSEU|nr:hypothetical protein [Amycolatopsis tolypomycina]SEB46349.1 hypothetical protein SAMN04489727_1952 [Amycolatopsis tolypomycina]
MTTSKPNEVRDLSDNDILRAALMTATWAAHEVLLDPDDLATARTQGHPLRIIHLPDGRILVTAAHAPTCPLITSGGQSLCDDLNCE